MNTNTFKASEFCSRKLWQLVNTPTDTTINDTELAAAISELATRRHYLEELQEIGKLGEYSPDA